MPRIPVMSSKDRYAVLILAALKYGDVDPTTFETDLKLSEATGLRETLTDQEIGEMLHVASYRFEAERLGDFSTFDPSGIDEAFAQRLADALHRQYMRLLVLGGKDFGDHLLAGSKHKVEAIRGGAQSTYLGEMAVILRADEILRGKKVVNPNIAALMFGVDSDAASRFFGDLEYGRQKMMDALAWKLPGMPPKAVKRVRRRSKDPTFWIQSPNN
ncbi:hypothetical protein HOI83_03650 [Candidatus Uhrbacteria bacterium]|jgi:hypothetical protein|nr:hypothetical protein [Candidatus Uhrbacteria bacterium]